MSEPTNYQSFVKRVNSACTPEQLERLERSLDRLYGAAIFSVNELQRLDDAILKRYDWITEKT